MDYRLKKYVRSKGSNNQVLKEVQEVFDILSKYYDKIEDGTHVLVIPDPFDRVTDEEANELIEKLDADIEKNESWRLKSQYDALPEFSRMASCARKAMYQELRRLFQYQKENIDEYLQDAGSILEPLRYTEYDNLYY